MLENDIYLVYFIEVINSRLTENYIHRIFEKDKIKSNREWYKIVN